MLVTAFWAFGGAFCAVSAAIEDHAGWKAFMLFGVLVCALAFCRSL